MKLYYKAGACSLAVHIALCELGINAELIPVDLANKTLKDGANFRDINSAGQVPTLQLDNGKILTEVAVLLQYLADQDATHALLPTSSDFARYEILKWLNVIATELHKTFSPLFKPNTPEDYKPLIHSQLAISLGRFNEQLSQQPYLHASGYSIADIYAFVVLGWSRYVGVELATYPHLEAFQARIAKREAVQKALTAEGLM